MEASRLGLIQTSLSRASIHLQFIAPRTPVSPLWRERNEPRIPSPYLHLNQTPDLLSERSLPTPMKVNDCHLRHAMEAVDKIV